MDNLKNFKNDPFLTLPGAEEEESLQSSAYHQEINTLKIEKLSNRVTLISVIIPCLICAILVFTYLDMKERVVDVDKTKNFQVEKMARQMEEKLNALDLRIAKSQFDLDQQLPLLTQKEQALENQVAKMSVSKADEKTIQANMDALEKKIKHTAAQSKEALVALEAVKVDVRASMEENTTQLDKKTSQIKRDILVLKEEFTAKLGEVSAYEEQIGLLRKTTSLLDKRLKGLELDGISKKEVDNRLSQVQHALEKMIQELDAKLERQISASLLPVKKPLKKVEKTLEKKASDIQPIPPQIDTDEIKSGSISEKTLTE